MVSQRDRGGYVIRLSRFILQIYAFAGFIGAGRVAGDTITVFGRDIIVLIEEYPNNLED